VGRSVIDMNRFTFREEYFQSRIKFASISNPLWIFYIELQVYSWKPRLH